MRPVAGHVPPSTEPDARLVELAREGDEQAFAEIVERYGPALERYCCRLARGTRAEDAVQQTFLSAWSAIRRGTEVRELRPWLYRIAHHATLRALAREGDGTAELPETLAAPGTSESEAEARLRLASTLSAVAALPERQREALIGTAVQGRTRDEIARALGVTDGAVRQLVHRARAAVRAAAAAVVPWPLLVRFSRGRGGGGLLGDRADLVAAGGSAGAAAAAVKLGVAATVAGALVVAPVALPEPRSQPSRTASSPAIVATRGLAPPAPGVLAAPWYAPPSRAAPDAASESPGSGPEAGHEEDGPVEPAAPEEPSAVEDPAGPDTGSADGDAAATDQDQGQDVEPVGDEPPPEDVPAEGEEEPAPEDPPAPEEEPPFEYVDPQEEPLAGDADAGADPGSSAEPAVP